MKELQAWHENLPTPNIEVLSLDLFTVIKNQSKVGWK
jgi:hypothetical protein